MATIAVENPATGETIRDVPETTPADLPALVARARSAQPGWDALGYEGRGRILKRAQKWLVEHADAQGGHHVHRDVESRHRGMQPVAWLRCSSPRVCPRNVLTLSNARSRKAPC